MRKSAIFLALFLAAVACKQTKTKRTNVGDDSEVMGTGIESADVEAMAKLSKSLLAVPELTNPHLEEQPRVAIFAIANDTRHDFDAELLVERLQNELIENSNNRVRFVTRSQHDLRMIEEERRKKREGEYTSTKQATKRGADYYLTGNAKAISSTSGKLEQDAIWIIFKLEDAETGDILWSRRYATKKVGRAGVVYR
ncbi:MAG: hypothetical protein ACYTGZ_05065 [Planctomycetota bacterium]|jgi:PBP1b-binding outer membrane lipoprotein LpoB